MLFAHRVGELVMSGWEFETVVTIVTNGGFGALVWYLIVKHMPAVERRHEAERDRWMAWIDNRDTAKQQSEAAQLEAMHTLNKQLADYDKQLALLREKVSTGA
jgi:hypothetical protein